MERRREARRRYLEREREEQTAVDHEFGPSELRGNRDWAEFFLLEEQDRASAGWSDDERNWPGDGVRDPWGGYDRGDEGFVDLSWDDEW